MAGVELASLTAPISEADPCGPDLDLEGDPDFLNYMARLEGRLPASFFSVQDGRPFDRASIDFAAEFEAAKPLLDRTRDLRLLAMVAKLHILNRDLSAFATCVETIAMLLEVYWDQVHPRGEGGDYALRVAAIETLDDLPTVVHPLQFVPLANHRRFGVVTYRHHMTAVGEVRPREDEEQPPDAATVDKALMESDLPPLVDLMRQFEALQETLGRIRTNWIERAGFDQAVSLERLPQTVGKILALVGGVVAKRDPSAAGVAPEEGAEPGPGELVLDKIRSTGEATEALAAVAGYFARMEPSNPALLLVRQAQQLIGRSFVDVIRMLVPEHAEQAMIAIGTEHSFNLPIERLSSLEAGPEAFEEELAPEEAGADLAAAETYSSEAIPPEEPATDDTALENAAPEEVVADDTVGQPGESAFAENAPGAEAAPPADRRRARVATRQQAFALMEQVAAYYRTNEPTSPIPVIIDRARHLAARDFMSLLKDFLPETALQTTNAEGAT